MDGSPPIDIGTRVDQYIKLRDKINEIKKQHKEQLKPYEDALETLGGILLNYLNTVNTDSAAIRGVGTVFRTEKKSATIADGDAFRRHVIGAQEWDLVDWRPNKTAVSDFVDENGHTPPGVNFTVTYDVNVRRK